MEEGVGFQPRQGEIPTHREGPQRGPDRLGPGGREEGAAQELSRARGLPSETQRSTETACS